MKITAIKVQAKRKDRFSIYVDGKYSFSLSDYQLVGSGLGVGEEYSAQQLNELIEQSKFGKAYERALNYVMIRPRSQKEIEDYLTRTYLYPKPKAYIDKAGQRHLKPQKVDKPKTKAMIERVINRLDEKGYINDTSFARAWVNSRLLNKKISRRKLWQELKIKGIAESIIDEILQAAQIDESETIRQLITKKRHLERYRDDRKMIEFLLRRGFKYDEIKAVMSEQE